jgi:heterotetrameric sarcosine oxidase gamma subunit
MQPALSAFAFCAPVAPTHPGATAHPVEPLSVISVIAWTGAAPALAASVRAAFGVALPPPGRWTQAGDLAALWVGPGHWWLQRERASPLFAELAPVAATHAALIDISDARAMLRISGPAAPTILASLLPIDLHPPCRQYGGRAYRCANPPVGRRTDLRPVLPAQLRRQPVARRGTGGGRARTAGLRAVHGGSARAGLRGHGHSGASRRPPYASHVTPHRNPASTGRFTPVIAEAPSPSSQAITRPTLQRRCAGETRRDRVHADALAAPFGGQGHGQVGHRRLGRAVAMHRG